MNIVPKLQQAACNLPLPQAAKNFFMHPAGPFTSEYIIELNIERD